MIVGEKIIPRTLLVQKVGVMKTQTMRDQRKRQARKIRSAIREAVHETGLKWTDWDLETVGSMSHDLAVRAESFTGVGRFGVRQAGDTAHD